MDFLTHLHLNPYILSLIIFFVGLLSYIYFAQYQKPANILRNQLIDINKNLRELGNSNQFEQVDYSVLEKNFSSKPFSNPWKEYRQSLHAMTSEDGERTTIRSTVPAETYFSKDAIVDIHINADFFRHLPGILTGVGIIGTFTGLVWGLGKFKPTDASGTLSELLGEVTSAFMGSGLAIFAAILITFFEKKTINDCYKEVDELNELLDGLFVSGVGEDYLARLVKASESSATSAAALKDDLIRALNDQSVKIGDSITGALKGPMESIGNAVQKVSGDQGQAVSSLLENLMTAFMAKIDETFGSQIQGINDSIIKSTESMSVVQNAMTKLIEDISKAGQSAASEMSLKMEEAMQRAALAQEKMNEQLRQFVEELKILMVQQQGATKQAMDETIQKVLAELEKAIASIAEERNKQIEQDRGRAEDLTTSTKHLYGGLSDNVSRLIEDIKLATIKTEENISQIQKVSVSAISGMNDGALNMRNAADKFTDAGSSVTGVLESSRNITTQMEQASQSLQGTTSIVRDLLTKYEETRKDNQSYVSELTNLIATAKKEAGVSEAIVSEMQKIITSLRTSEKLSTEYLDGINKVLTDSFETFNAELLAKVQQINSENDKLMASSIGALRGAVETMVASTMALRKEA